MEDTHNGETHLAPGCSSALHDLRTLWDIGLRLETKDRPTTRGFQVWAIHCRHPSWLGKALDHKYTGVARKGIVAGCNAP